MQTSYVFRCDRDWELEGERDAIAIANPPLGTRESTPARRKALGPAGVTFVRGFSSTLRPEIKGDYLA